MPKLTKARRKVVARRRPKTSPSKVPPKQKSPVKRSAMSIKRDEDKYDERLVTVQLIDLTPSAPPDSRTVVVRSETIPRYQLETYRSDWGRYPGYQFRVVE